MTTVMAKAMGKATVMAKRGGRSALPCRVAASLSCGSSACGPPSSIRRRFVGGDAALAPYATGKGEMNGGQKRRRG